MRAGRYPPLSSLMMTPMRFLYGAALMAAPGTLCATCLSSHAQSAHARLIIDMGYQPEDKSAMFEIDILAPSDAVDSPRTLYMTAATTNERGYLAMSNACIPGPTGAESILAGRRWKLTRQPKVGKSWTEVQAASDIEFSCVPLTLQSPPSWKIVGMRPGAGLPPRPRRSLSVRATPAAYGICPTR
jgi:hypothetical protein